MGGGSSEFFQIPGPIFREINEYDDSHLASFGASLFQVPQPRGESSECRGGNLAK